MMKKNTDKSANLEALYKKYTKSSDRHVKLLDDAIKRVDERNAQAKKLYKVLARLEKHLQAAKAAVDRIASC